jgi:hypothetical protein
MTKLNLPEYDLKIKHNGQTIIFDIFRKKFVALTPEERVRQLFLHYLINEFNYPLSLIAVEYQLQVNKLKKRCDAVVFSNNGKPLLILEFKKPDCKISQAVFDQIARYNIPLQVNYLIVSNGLEHYCCQIDHAKLSYSFMEHIPGFEEINNK